MGLVEASPETVAFWEAVRSEKLLVKFCPQCRKHLHPRRIVCPACGGTDLEWVASTGMGELYSFSVIHRAPTKELALIAPYAVGIVRLDEQVHLFTRLDVDHDRLAVGMRVKVGFRELENGQYLPVFLEDTREPQLLTRDR